MALILNSGRFIRGLVRLTRQRALIPRKKNYNFLQGSSAFRFLARNTASLAAEPVDKEDFHFERLLYQLRSDIQNQNVLIEDVKEVLEGLKRKGEITYSQLIMLLKSCSEVAFLSSSSDRIQLAEEIWKAAADLGAEFDITHYNALLNVFVENSHSFSPAEFLSMLKKEGVEPNQVTFRRLLRAFCQQGDMEGANSILDKMKNLDYALSEADFNSLILGNCETGDFNRACEIISLMEEKNIDPTAKTYLFLLCGYAKHGKFVELESFLKDMPNRDIYVSDHFLLEIVYALASNGHTEYIDTILDELNHTPNESKFTCKIIQRLLHKGLDSVAFKVFERLETEGRSTEYIRSRSRFILTHFVMHRDPEKILEVCRDLETRGCSPPEVGDFLPFKKRWTVAGESYVLKKMFLLKDEQFCIRFIETMSSQGKPVRKHYFWPVIIKASKKGNAEMLNILNQIPKWCLSDNLTAHNVIIPNYKFGEEWRVDLEALSNCGRIPYLTDHLLQRLISQERFDEAEVLASTYALQNPSLAARFLARSLISHPDLEKHFVNILCYLEHDRSVIEEFQKKTEKASDGNTEIFDRALDELKNLEDEQVFLRILQAMLEKKMCIGSKMGSLIQSKHENQEIVDVVNKLTSPDLKFDYDQDVLANRKAQKGQDKKQNWQSILFKEVESANSVEELFKPLVQLVRNHAYDKALAIIEDYSQRQDLSLMKSERYLSLVREFLRQNQIDSAKRAFDIGLGVGVLAETETLSFVRMLFYRNKFMEGIDVYQGYIRRYDRAVSAFEFLHKVVASKNEEAIRRLTGVLCDTLPRFLVMSCLALELASEGEIRKAKKTLDLNEIKLSENEVYRFCAQSYRRSTPRNLENCLEFLKNFEHFDRVPMYKLLLKKYAEQEDVEKAKELWPKIEEDDISDYHFLGQMREFVNNPVPKTLRDLAETLSEVGGEVIGNEEGAPENESNVELNEAMRTKQPLSVVDNLMNTLASKGKTYEIISLLKRYRSEINIEDVVEKFFWKNNPVGYINFLKLFVKEGKFNDIAFCFKLPNPQRLLKDRKKFQVEYTSLAIQCYETGGVVEPLHACFVALMSVPVMVKKAEEILERYQDHFKSVSFLALSTFSTRQTWFYEGLISSDVFNSVYSNSLPQIYSELIYSYCKGNRLERAVESLNNAISKGIGKDIDYTVLDLLEKKLNKEGKSFPHPELLRSNT